MKSKLFTPQFIFVTSAILLGAISRLLPHIDNATPIAAMALFGGAYITNKRLAFIIPLVAMLLSDLAMEAIFGWGLHNTLIYVYVAFAITTLIGIYVGKKVSVTSVLIGSLASSVLFFIITNFGYWAANGFFMGATGLGVSYLGGLPFFRTTLFGDLFYNALFFGTLYLAQTRIPAFVKSK